MSLLHLRWFSQTLQKQVETHIINPDCAPPPYPVLYLLHGLSDDSSNWLRWTRIEHYAQPFPMLIVMPDGFRGFYTNNEQGAAYGDYMVKELPEVIERTFRVRSNRASRAIGGLSMGGYGALRLALAHPYKYCSAHSHSGALSWGRTAHFEELAAQPRHPAWFLEEIKRVFGSHPDGTVHDLFALAQKAKNRRPLPKIRLDCGKDDFLLQANRSFSATLKELEIPHVYFEAEGGHNWDYWDQQIKGALEFHARCLKATTGQPNR